MASLTPRASILWSDTAMAEHSYFPDDLDVEQQQRLIGSDAEAGDDDDGDRRTPLDKTIDRIGMGSYQWALLSLCGFGWMADNMWIQAMAIILPRVQQHYDVSDGVIGSVSSSMFAGMMLGAVGWGTCSDLLGRSTAFNLTLFFTSVFGFFASLANSFFTLCLALFLLGTAVGGSMPTDGTLLLEHMPKEKQYLVTALSVFFSFGSVLSAFVALLVLPDNSCPNSPSGPISGLRKTLVDGVAATCDVETQNRGWKYLLMTLATITLSMFLARIVFFRLHESPRYLVHAGRPQEAVKSLQMISRFNGSDLEIELDDVADHHPVEPTTQSSPSSSPPTTTLATATSATALNTASGTTGTTLFDAGDIERSGLGSGSGSRSGSGTTSPTAKSSSDRAPLVTQYDSIGQTTTNVLEGRSFQTPTTDYPPPPHISLTSSSETVTGPTDDEDKLADTDKLEISQAQEDEMGRPKHVRHGSSNISSSSRVFTSRRGELRRLSSASSRRSSMYEVERRCRLLPRSMRKPLAVWWDRVSMVLEPEWFRTTVLVWAMWFSMSLAFTMFNVYLPKLLEMGGDADVERVKTLEESLWDVMVFTIGGTPGAILGAYLIESSLGRRWSLAMSTFTTAAFCLVFAMGQSSWVVRISTVGISLSATTMWAVLYGWTPEIFGTKVEE
ncbi:hypothetical protein NP233_g2872 [Leucocoprinus birnbaumii]|uniref:Major facilitator superfamily (MFS) profile domain-containing protein n=1 Tax=Leucocoprinus birnbaumii TaxID=56174 RepID=A0AAD5VZZ1_9AGAR|nr:hypothetical protein NP233_g2872 [Leucocoprinus birnbaumii]